MAPVPDREESESTLASLGLHRPSELIYRTCYAPVDLAGLLETAENRSRIRRLSVPQIYFGLKELGEHQIQALLPHITETQWQGVLDLDLWNRDRANAGKFLFWAGQIIQAENPVAAKIVRGTDRQLLELWLKRRIRIEEIVEDDPGPAPKGDFMETPDRAYLVHLPNNPDESRLARGLLLKLYELGPEETQLWIQESRYRTSIELEEAAYQNRKRRIEEMGFQDYFDALDVYTYLPQGTPLPEKIRDKLRAVGTLPAPVARMKSGPLLLFQALAAFARPHELEPLMEELFFVCNKILSADRTPPNRTSRVKRAIRKALSGINLGLEIWAEGDLNRARDGLRRHYLQSFFHTGYSRLVELRDRAREIRAQVPLEPGSPLDDALAELARNYPLLLVEIREKRRRRFLKNTADLERASGYLAAAAEETRK
jgi:hypothetical protein